MLRFFRRIRQKLLIENRFSKYLLYAIGEILLVVIGILIALYIDNRQTEHQERLMSMDLLRNIQSDLKQDTTNLQSYADLLEQVHNTRIDLLGREDLDTMQVDSLMYYVMPFYRMVRLTDQAYQKIKNMGLTQLTGFESTYDEINRYYTAENEYYIQRMNWDTDLTLEEAAYWYHNKDFEHYYYEVFYKDSLPSRQSTQERRRELIALLDHTEVRNMLRTSAFRKRLVREAVLLTKARAVELLSSIEAVLREYQTDMP